MSQLAESSDVVPARALCTGDMVGNYRLEGVIADGGMGVVYRAVHAILPRRAAIKVLHPEMLGKWSASERMLQEARVMESIAGPTVVQIYDAGHLEDGRPWVAMELVEGETLAEYLERHGTMAPDQVAELLVALADALAPAHVLNVVHRDVKPDNIMLTDGHGAQAVRLIDWGIARVATNSDARITQVDTTPGTPNYMAPEQIRGHAVDGRTDVYALGVVAFELLTGKPPYSGDNAIEVVVKHLTADPPSVSESCPGVPAGLDALILRMLAKKPADRPTLAEIRSEIAQLGQGPIEDDCDLPEIELEMEMEVDDVLGELEAEGPVEEEEPIQTCGETPAVRGRIRWTPPMGARTAPIHGGIVSAIEHALDGTVRVGGALVPVSDNASVAGEIITRD